MFPKRTQAILDLCTSGFMFLFLAALLWHGIPEAIESVMRLETRMQVCKPPVYIFKSILAFGVVMFSFQAIATFIRTLAVATGKVAPSDKRGGFIDVGEDH